MFREEQSKVNTALQCWYSIQCLPFMYMCSDIVFPFLWCQVEGVFYVNDALEKLMFEELRNACRGGGKYVSILCVTAQVVSSCSLKSANSTNYDLKIQMYRQGMIKI